jgi:hypothetical protein
MLPICLSSSLFFFFFSSLLLLASPVIARTTGFRTYDTLVPGEDTVFTITTSSYNSVVYDEVMLFGLSSASEWRKGDLGYPFVSTKILGPGKQPPLPHLSSLFPPLFPPSFANAKAKC